MSMYKSVIGLSIVIFATFQPICVVHSADTGVIDGVLSGRANLDDPFQRRSVRSISDKRDLIPSWSWQMNQGNRDIRKTLRDWGEAFKFSETVKDIRELVMRIRDYHDKARRQKNFIDKKTKMAPRVEEAYKFTADHTLRDLIKNEPLLIIHQNIRNIFKNYSSQTERHLLNPDFGHVCTTRLSLLQAVSSLVEDVKSSSHLYYDTIVTLLSIMDQSTSRDTQEGLTKEYGRLVSEWYKETIAVIKPALSKISRKLYACGLPSTSNEDSLIELKISSKFFVRMCNDYFTPDFFECPMIGNTLMNGKPFAVKECPGTKANEFCSVSRPCRGKLHECKAMSDLNTDVCISESSKDPRYQYYRTTLTPATTAYNYRKCHIWNLNKIERWEYLDLPFISLTKKGEVCSSCDCTCEEGEYFINLAPAHSEVSSNMVVTGAKFILKNNVLELHIQQAKLLPNGQIDNVTMWIGPQWETLQKVSQNDAKRIILSTTTLSLGRVLTGLQLDYGTANDFKSQRSYIFLRIFSNECNFKKGLVNSNKPQIAGLRAAFPETELNMTNLISPRKAGKDGEEFIKNDAWVTLSTSNGVDGGQSTIPFFDSQEVTSGKPTLLSGAGLYYKGGEDWAGYIGIELHTYDISKFIADDLDAE